MFICILRPVTGSVTFWQAWLLAIFCSQLSVWVAGLGLSKQTVSRRPQFPVHLHLDLSWLKALMKTDHQELERWLGVKTALPEDLVQASHIHMASLTPVPGDQMAPFWPP